jgi:hypothetical protein
MKYIKEFLTYNKLGYSYLKERGPAKSYLAYFGNNINNDELDREVEKIESEIANKLKSMTDGIGEYTNFVHPDFGDRIRKNKDVMDSFMHRMPFIKPLDFETVCAKVIDITNVETLAIYFSNLFPFIEKIEEVLEKIKKAHKEEGEPAKGKISGLASLEKDYTLWVKRLKELKSKVESKDFLAKIADKKELEVTYKKKDGKGEADGKIIGFDIKDNGVVFSIENDKVGKIQKNLNELTPETEGETGEDDIQKKMTDLIKSKPDNVKKVLKFVNFISDEKNKDKIDTIQKMIAKE